MPDFPEHHPQFDRARVKRFVIAGHGNLAAVKAMLAEEPNLINGTIDWGNGDFETALGGASHMGRRDIAEFLLEHNARMDIFAATMLGQTRHRESGSRRLSEHCAMCPDLMESR